MTDLKREHGEPQPGGGEDGNNEGDRGRSNHPDQPQNVNRPPKEHDIPADRDTSADKPGGQPGGTPRVNDRKPVQQPSGNPRSK